MALTSGYYMPQVPYYNPQQYTVPSYVPQAQSYAPPMYSQQNLQGVIYVDGEVAARAMQIPDNWDKSKALAFWDTTGPYIYIRSFNPVGIPNPLMRLRYVVDNQPQDIKLLPTDQQVSGDDATGGSAYVTREELTKLEDDMNEIKEMLKQHQENQGGNVNRGGTQGGQNRGGNR